MYLKHTCFVCLATENILHTGLLRRVSEAAVPRLPVPDVRLAVPPALLRASQTGRVPDCVCRPVHACRTRHAHTNSNRDWDWDCISGHLKALGHSHAQVPLQRGAGRLPRRSTHCFETVSPPTSTPSLPHFFSHSPATFFLILPPLSFSFSRHFLPL